MKTSKPEPYIYGYIFPGLNPRYWHACKGAEPSDAKTKSFDSKAAAMSYLVPIGEDWGQIGYGRSGYKIIRRIR